MTEILLFFLFLDTFHIQGTHDKKNGQTMQFQEKDVTSFSLKTSNASRMCLGQSLSDVMVHQYIGVQANQEKLPRKCWNFTFLMGGHLMHFNLSVFSLFLTVLLKWNYYALASQYIDHWSIQGHFQINIFIDFKTTQPLNINFVLNGSLVSNVKSNKLWS